jgi:solute carrier family 12 (sodium/potassium/chloride transporter), member 2
MAEKTPKKPGYEFGTFQGVFTPNILTILGVIMYLRFGWVLGNIGLWKTVLVIALSTFITLMTSFSISQLATNAKMGGGGAYYMVSRSLGIQAGAAIGIPLFLGQALGVAFYVTGFTESLAGLLPQYPAYALGILTLVIITILAYASADIALKIQFVIMTLLGLSLVSFFLGNASGIQSLPAPAFQPASFWVVFAVFFPAVTGILSGLSMSGDLKSPSKSIPVGTIASVLISFLIYMAVLIFLHRLNIPREVLVENPLIMQHIAKWKHLILLGLWSATISSAIGSILSAPRTLQALARDSVVFKGLGRGFGKNKDPHLALLITFLLGVGGVLSGSLDVIASLLTMFFLTTYGLLNLSAAIEGLIDNPSWRPMFRIHWGFSFAGALSCFAAMLLINAGVTLIALFVSGCIYAYMHKRKMNAYWGDMKYAILMLFTKLAIYRLTKEKAHEKSWRPNILVLSGSPASRWNLIAIADAISHGKGFLTIAALLKEDKSDTDRIDNMRKSVESYLRDRKVPAIVRVQQTGDDILKGASELISHYGFGPLVPNTVLAGISEKKENERSFSEMILTAHRKRKNLILVHEAENIHDLKHRQIDVWWRRGGTNAGLMLALAYLLMTSPEWSGAKMSLKTIIAENEDPKKEELHLGSFLRQANIEADVEVLPFDPQGPQHIMRQSSREADLVFLGLREPEVNETIDQYASYYASFLSTLEGYPPTVLVLTSEEIDFQKIFELHETASNNG